MVDTQRSGRCARKGMGVRVPPSAPIKKQPLLIERRGCFFMPQRRTLYCFSLNIKDSDVTSQYQHFFWIGGRISFFQKAKKTLSSLLAERVQRLLSSVQLFHNLSSILPRICLLTSSRSSGLASASHRIFMSSDVCLLHILSFKKERKRERENKPYDH